MMNSSVTWQVAGLLTLAIVLIAAAVWIGYNKRNSPERREQRRRLFVNREGRLGEAMIIDVIDDALVFQYEVNGVSYTGSQDVSGLRQFLPRGFDRLIGQTASCRSPPQRTGRLVGQESILNWVSPCISSRRILENRARSWGNLGQ